MKFYAKLLGLALMVCIAACNGKSEKVTNESPVADSKKLAQPVAQKEEPAADTIEEVKTPSIIVVNNLMYAKSLVKLADIKKMTIAKQKKAFENINKEICDIYFDARNALEQKHAEEKLAMYERNYAKELSALMDFFKTNDQSGYLLFNEIYTQVSLEVILDKDIVEDEDGYLDYVKMARTKNNGERVSHFFRDFVKDYKALDMKYEPITDRIREAQKLEDNELERVYKVACDSVFNVSLAYKHL